MGFKIWRKDGSIWELAFDSIYPTRDLAEIAIGELNAAYHERVLYGELAFYIYPDDVKIDKKGSIVDKFFVKGKVEKNRYRKS
jgi:hypothetical protein